MSQRRTSAHWLTSPMPPRPMTSQLVTSDSPGRGDPGPGHCDIQLMRPRGQRAKPPNVVPGLLQQGVTTAGQTGFTWGLLLNPKNRQQDKITIIMYTPQVS